MPGLRLHLILAGDELADCAGAGVLIAHPGDDRIGSDEELADVLFACWDSQLDKPRVCTEIPAHETNTIGSTGWRVCVRRHRPVRGAPSVRDQDRRRGDPHGRQSAYGLSIRSALELAAAEMNGTQFLGGTQGQPDLHGRQGGQAGRHQRLHPADQRRESLRHHRTHAQQHGLCRGPCRAEGRRAGAGNEQHGDRHHGHGQFRLPRQPSAVRCHPGHPCRSQGEVPSRRRRPCSTRPPTSSARARRTSSRQRCSKLGIQLVATESYSKGDSDFRTQLSKLNARKPDIFVLSSLVGEAIPILQQAREIGITQPIVGGNGFNSPNVLKNAGCGRRRAHRGKRMVHRQRRAEEQVIRHGLPGEVRR